MPWSDNTEPRQNAGGKPGPWGSPPPSRGSDNDDQRPSGGGPQRRPPSPTPPPDDLGMLWRRLSRGLASVLGGARRGMGAGAIAVGFGVVVGLWLLSGFYAVGPAEQAVVTTFGVWTRTEGPGPHYHLPAPIEAVDTVAVDALNQTKIDGADDPTVTLMPTSDGNIADVTLTAQWRVKDVGAYLFKLDDTDAAVADIAATALREVVGRTSLASLMTTGRGAAQDQTRALMQSMLDAAGAGVTVVGVQIDPQPPHEAAAAYQAVAAAQAYADTAAGDARAYVAKASAQAKGDAAAAVAAAQADRAQSVAEAQGEAARFDALDAQYRAAPDATRERLYVETMRKIAASANKVIVDTGQPGAPIVLPPDLFKPATQGHGAVAPSAPAAQGGGQ